MLTFAGHNITSDEALAVFCVFFQQPLNTNASSLALRLFNLPLRQFRLLLESLHANKFIKELQIQGSRLDNWDNDATLSFCNLLNQKNDWIALRFRNCHIRIADILPGFRHRHEHLQELEFSDCLRGAFGDEELRLILETIEYMNFPCLENVDLRFNEITSGGLRSLAQLGPAVLRRLRKLNLSGNENLFDDLESTGEFVRTMLVSDDMAIKELRIGDCGRHMPAIIKACEHDKNTLKVLDVGEVSDPTIGDQVVESIPMMNKLEHFICDVDRSDIETQNAISTALCRNTSIVKLTSGYSRFEQHPLDHLVAPILNRNQYLMRPLKHADSLMALQPKTRLPIGSKSGIWYMAFVKMTPPPPPPPTSNDATDNGIPTQPTESPTQPLAGGYPGASARFKILQQRPAILVPLLKRPLSRQQDAPPTSGSGGDDDDAKPCAKTDEEVAEDRKRQRL